MNANLIAIIIILLIVGFAVAFLIKEKRKGTRCIGCPSSCSCGSKKSEKQ